MLAEQKQREYVWKTNNTKHYTKSKMIQNTNLHPISQRVRVIAGWQNFRFRRS